MRHPINQSDANLKPTADLIIRVFPALRAVCILYLVSTLDGHPCEVSLIDRRCDYFGFSFTTLTTHCLSKLDLVSKTEPSVKKGGIKSINLT